MAGVRGRHELLGLHSEQVVFSHDARHSFVIHQHPSAPQLRSHPPITVAPPMFQGDPLNGGPHFHAFFQRYLLFQRPIEARTADPRRLTHALDTQAALHRHYFADLLEDAVSPDLLPLRRRASTFCKAPLKKSTSSVFSASTRFRSRTSFRSSRTGD